MKIHVPFTNVDIVGHHPGNDIKKAVNQEVPAHLTAGRKILDYLPFKFKDRGGRAIINHALAQQKNSTSVLDIRQQNVEEKLLPETPESEVSNFAWVNYASEQGIELGTSPSQHTIFADHTSETVRTDSSGSHVGNFAWVDYARKQGIELGHAPPEAAS